MTDYDYTHLGNNVWQVREYIAGNLIATYDTRDIKRTFQAGSINRAAAEASGTQVITTGHLSDIIFFSAVSSANDMFSSDGWDTVNEAVSTRTTTVTVLSTILSICNKSHESSIYVVNTLGAGWKANISTISNTSFTLNWTKLGAGLNITVKYLSVFNG